MNQLRFRTRLVLILSLFAIVPALLLTLLWSGTVSTVLPFVTGQSAWDSVAASGERAIAAARQSQLTPSQRRAIDAHERELRTSVEQARRCRLGHAHPALVGFPCTVPVAVPLAASTWM